MQWLAMDVGGSGIKYALADESYQLSEAGVLPTCNDTHDGFIDAVGSIYDRFAGTVTGIAMSSCGELDPDTGHMFSGGTLTFNNGTNMIDAVTARCGIPVTVENDANCALLAEAHLGCLTDCRNAVVLVIGTSAAGPSNSPSNASRTRPGYRRPKSFPSTTFHEDRASQLHWDSGPANGAARGRPRFGQLERRTRQGQ